METNEQIPSNEEAVLAELDAIIKSKTSHEKGFEDVLHKIVGFLDAIKISGMVTQVELDDSKIYHLLTKSSMFGTHKLDIEGGLLERFIREEL